MPGTVNEHKEQMKAKLVELHDLRDAFVKDAPQYCLDAKDYWREPGPRAAAGNPYSPCETFFLAAWGWMHDAERTLRVGNIASPVHSAAYLTQSYSDAMVCLKLHAGDDSLVKKGDSETVAEFAERLTRTMEATRSMLLHSVTIVKSCTDEMKIKDPNLDKWVAECNLLLADSLTSHAAASTSSEAREVKEPEEPGMRGGVGGSMWSVGDVGDPAHSPWGASQEDDEDNPAHSPWGASQGDDEEGNPAHSVWGPTPP